MILDVLNYVLFTVPGLNAPVTVLEAIAFIAGAACVYGVAKQYQWNWPVAIVNAAAFLLLFINVGLYADALLQIVFIALSVYGWVYWGRDRGGKNTAVGKSTVPIRRAETTDWWLVTSIGVGVYALTAWWLASVGSTVVWADAFILTASLAATYMQARKIIESWWVWIAVDVVSIPLYLYKGLALTAILYVVFLTLCIIGLRDWTRDLRADRQRWHDTLGTPAAGTVR